MLLVDGLAGDAERFGDLRPRPALAKSTLNGGVLDVISQPPQGANRGKRIGRILRDTGGHNGVDASTLVDRAHLVNLS
jgi:hypothetical protein